MYLEHFGLKEFPFSITPDTDFAFGSKHHQEAINTVMLALAGNEGFVKVTGEIGTGKTLVCRHLLANLPKTFVSAYLLNPRLAPNDMLRALTQELGVRLRPGTDDYAMFRALDEALLKISRSGRRAVLFMDEAHALSMDTLDALRLLSNLETGKRKLIQIVLFGQPELDDILQTRRMRSLASRIAFSARIEGLSHADFGPYLQHRMGVAGWNGPRLFSSAACSLLWHASAGSPRKANILAHKCLMLAFGRGRQDIGWQEAWAAAHDDNGWRRRRPALAPVLFGQRSTNTAGY